MSISELKPPSSMSELQQKILQVICTQDNVTYKSLIEKTKKDRITVLQSVNSLIKQKYIIKHKTNPEYEKSKLIFKPTYNGKMRALSMKVVNLEEILMIENDKEITKFLELFHDIIDVSQRKKLIQPLEVFYTSLVAIQAKGKPPLQFKKRVLTDTLKAGILELAQKDKYDTSLLLNERSILLFNELFSSKEMKELKYFLVNVRNNLSKTIERLPN